MNIFEVEDTTPRPEEQDNDHEKRSRYGALEELDSRSRRPEPASNLRSDVPFRGRVCHLPPIVIVKLSSAILSERAETKKGLRLHRVPYVKICGMTSDADIAAAVGAGADAVGFLVGLKYESEDELSPDRAHALIRSLPPFVTSVLVTHQGDPSSVAQLCERIPAAHLQLHGDFPLKAISPLRRLFPYVKIIKAVHVRDNLSIDSAKETAKHVDAIILDTQTSTRLGGTGQVHDWSISYAINQAVRPTPVILAGGLTPDNVAIAIASVQPFGVDVNSGVSIRRGVKSPELARCFVANAKNA